ncbi:DNA starvation/stationary phase protection protein [Paenibacillus sp.]|uniref:Dps family protein n=1 Tax=Paenibacillus sp. TaxID=58172 RepID=UPI00282F3199|nr:DNA starvation/stationary phase protection protein [Paenibacillus sp.]MDR0270973.1 DNA starvation/stationary phase protection protein [Paenibacillus sp.]
MAKTSSNSKVTTLEQLLNQEVANLNVLYVKIHNFHWYVKGDNFFTLHAKFEEIYNDITLKMDEVAERLLIIKGSPAATMKEYLELATIQEASGNPDARQMVQILIGDFTTIVEEMHDGIHLAEEAGDHPTADLCIRIKNDLEKQMWMLRAYLG